MRRPQMSELIRSESCQSGPCSNSTTFLPACASTAAKVAPDAPAPTMATSTFSLPAISPPLRRRDMRHVRNAQALVPGHGAIDDIDRVAAQNEIDERPRRTLPTLDLALPQVVDEIVLLAPAELNEAAAAIAGLARAIDRPEHAAIEIDEGRPHVEDAGLQQGIIRRDRHLLVDEVGKPGRARPRDQRLADRLEGLHLL